MKDFLLSKLVFHSSSFFEILVSPIQKYQISFTAALPNFRYRGIYSMNVISALVLGLRYVISTFLKQQLLERFLKVLTGLIFFSVGAGYVFYTQSRR